MRAAIRLRGSDGAYAVTVKDISSTGLRASGAVSLFPGALVEVELPNIGGTPAEVVRAEEGTIAAPFGAIIDPDQAQAEATGSYRAPPPSPAARLSCI